MLSSARGFIQLPIVLLILLVTATGSYIAPKIPEKVREVKSNYEAKKLAQDSVPAGTASSQEILVGFREGVQRGQADVVHKRARGRVKKNIEKLNTDVVVVDGESISGAIDAYKQMPEVEYAEPNFIASAVYIPNDSLYGSQWNLEKIGSGESFDVSKGGYSSIAVIDTGVDSGHSDLSGSVSSGYNTIDENEDTRDENGHGTHVAGIAAAASDNGTGIASVSFQAKVLPVKVLSKDGWGYYSDIAEGIVYATDQGARIINLSLGGGSDSETLKKAVRFALSKGGLIVAAAGNNGNNAPFYPASYPGVLAVSASDQQDNLASFSSYGSNIFTASPGVGITSTVPGGDYKTYSGTSMSAPHLSGLL
ncbi:MAG: S8 family serine peptidase, partial [bacterium]|nr:S8 family serine peptidase [bacterium]